MLRSRRLDPVLVALGALGNQQHRWATDILVEALPVLVTAGDTEMVLDTFDQLRDPRALPALAAVWVPGERYVAELYARIHRLAGSRDPLPGGIARDVEEEAKRREARQALRERDPAEAKLGVRRLQLRCTACGRTGDYDFAPEALAAVLRFDGAEREGKQLPSGTVVACKHCGVKNAYAVNAFSRISAEGGLQALEASRRRGGGEPTEGPAGRKTRLARFADRSCSRRWITPRRHRVECGDDPVDVIRTQAGLRADIGFRQTLVVFVLVALGGERLDDGRRREVATR